MIGIDNLTEEQQDELNEIKRAINEDTQTRVIYNLLTTEYKHQTSKEGTTIDVLGDLVEDMKVVRDFIKHRTEQTITREKNGGNK